MILNINTPINTDMKNVVVGARVMISGIVYTARDAILPKIANKFMNGSLQDFPVSLQGAAIMHTAFSPAGFGPTSSNKEEIEGTMGVLSEAGVRLHIGKGIIKPQTVAAISKYGAMFIVVPPVSALLQSRLISKRVVAFEEEGMEALHELHIRDMPGVIAAAGGRSLFY
jgi:fumarate hydratase subunit beta